MGKINQFHIVTGQAARLAHTPVQMEDLGANHQDLWAKANTKATSVSYRMVPSQAGPRASRETTKECTLKDVYSNWRNKRSIIT